ncbi:MAG: stage V sporulation protein AC [Ruminococcaceae bacterium]|nr:stage V sporulation protein AC [Oscillospiraceae bacterium]
MNMESKKNYSKMVEKETTKSPIVKDCIFAFLIGGAICTVGQGLTELYMSFDMGKTQAQTVTSVTLVFLGVLLTALHLYEKIAKYAGAGTLVPITGFANSVASPAIEFKSEGFILGVGAKMFSIAGPVIVYGVVASVIYGVIYYIVQML